MSEKITVIEDNEDVRNNVKEILETEGYEVSLAENGEIGLEVIRRTQPHLVICDIMMPEMDGYEVLEKMRKNPAIAATPFVFLTAKTSKDDLSKGMELGADDYIMKPFTIDELVSRVRMRLERRKEVIQRSEQKLKNITEHLGLPITKEINTPLKTINAMSELIMMEHFNMEKSELVEFVSLINKAGLELRDIVGKTVNYYQIEKLEHDAKLFNELKEKATQGSKEVLTTLISSIAAEFQRSSDTMTSLEDADLSIPQDYFAQALKEVLNNAFKYSTKGSMIKVVSGIDAKRLKIKISDEGMGMSDEQIAGIQAFSSDENSGGLGLGLINAKKIIELFDGSISFSSQKGIGTTVQISIPVL